MTALTRATVEAMLAGATPGPWSVFGASSGKTIAVDASAKPTGKRPNIVDWPGFDGCDQPLKRQRGNARLIAASPDLARALLAAWDERDAALAREAALRGALQGLEWACEQLAATRTRDVYEAMIDSGQTDELLSLDARRQAARAALKGDTP